MIKVITLLKKTTTATSDVFESTRSSRSPTFADTGSILFHTVITGTGAVSAAVEIYGNTISSNDGRVLLQTHTLSDTDIDSAADAVVYPWPFFYAKITAISGTNALVDVRMAG